MYDRELETPITEPPQLDPTLSKLLQYCLLEAKERIEKKGAIRPFTAVAVKDTLFLEDLPGDKNEDFFKAAAHTVKNVKGAEAYGFCYDGYFDTDAGLCDAVIAEGGLPGELEGYAIAYVYEGDGKSRKFIDPIIYIGKAPNYMAMMDTSDTYESHKVKQAEEKERLDKEIEESVEAIEEQETEDAVKDDTRPI